MGHNGLRGWIEPLTWTDKVVKQGSFQGGNCSVFDQSHWILIFCSEIRQTKSPKLHWLSSPSSTSAQTSVYSNTELVLFADNPFSSSSASFPSPSALRLLATDSCWTSTSANAGGDSTIQAEWPSTDTKVGYKSLCDTTENKIHFLKSNLSDENF